VNGHDAEIPIDRPYTTTADRCALHGQGHRSRRPIRRSRKRASRNLKRLYSRRSMSISVCH